MKNLIYLLLCSSIIAILACGQSNQTSKAASGSKIFRQYCVTCHGMDGKSQLNGAKDLTISVLPMEERLNVITNGRKTMAAYKSLLSSAELKAVAEYTMQLK